MSMPKLLPIACAFIGLIGSATASAAEGQRWRVQIVDDTAVLQASKDTEYKFVKATISALKDAETEMFALRHWDPAGDVVESTLWYSINIVDDTAEITASTDLPYKYLTTLISRLKDSGIEKMKFTVHGVSTGEGATAANQRIHGSEVGRF